MFLSRQSKTKRHKDLYSKSYPVLPDFIFKNSMTWKTVWTEYMSFMSQQNHILNLSFSPFLALLSNLKFLLPEPFIVTTDFFLIYIYLFIFTPRSRQEKYRIMSESLRTPPWESRGNLCSNINIQQLERLEGKSVLSEVKDGTGKYSLFLQTWY